MQSLRHRLVDETISKYTKEANEENIQQLERMFRKEMKKHDANEDLDKNEKRLKEKMDTFNREIKVLKHKLRCIGGTDESHYLVTNKGPSEVDVIPNTYVYCRIPVQG